MKKDELLYSEKDFLDVLKMFAPGTSMRTALDDLLRARMGAIIAIHSGTEEFGKIVEGGFKIDSDFSAQRLVELCKMDGAIILSDDLKKIVFCNALLVPSPEIPTKETGTRHKAAERTAKQAQTIVIAVSERKNKISIFYKNLKYELEGSSEILRRAAETLQILEKQRELFNDLISNFNILEINGLVTVEDVCHTLQRLEIIRRISDIVKRYLIELGREGMIVNMRLKELISNLSRERDDLLRDYFFAETQRAEDILEEMAFDELLEVSNIAKKLFEDFLDSNVSPRGYRILKKTKVLDQYIDSLTSKFKTLDNVLSLEEDKLIEVFEDEKLVHFFHDELNSLKEKIMIGKN